MIRIALLLLAFAALPVAAEDAHPESQAIGEILSVGAPPVIDIDAALGADAVGGLRRVYAARDNRPFWFTTAEAPAAHALLERLAQPDMTIGANLQPLLEAAKTRIASADVQARAGGDLLLTALYGATARAMRPKEAPAGFAAALDELAMASDVATLLREPEAPRAETAKAETPAVETPKPEDPKVEAPAEPAPLARLRAAIAALQKSADWPQVPDGPKLQPGDTGSRVEVLSRRLIASGDLRATSPGSSFDPALKAALQHFQARHGLSDDGVAGAVTIAALNVPLRDRLATLNANLKRIEGDSRSWGDRFLAVNIPAAVYYAVDAGKTIASSPVLLGASTTPTPVLSTTIDRVLLHPSWKIPQAYADRVLWPRQEQDATYFYSHGIHVTDDGLRQDPGPGNPLGPVKLLFAGNDRIALHGAPGNDALATPDRFTSQGCIALPEIGALAKHLLAADPAWPEGRIDGALAVGGSQTVTLAKPLPLHVVYDTAWVEEDGTIQFRNDVYGWDKQMPATDSNTIADPCGS